MAKIANEARIESEQHAALHAIGQPVGPPAASRVQWGPEWTKRARFARKIAAGEAEAFDIEGVIEALPLPEYWLLLTGEAVPRDGKVLCLWHEERTASCHVKERKFRCYGCDFRGNVYDL